MEVFWVQLNEVVQIVALDKFLTCARDTMIRQVFPGELADRELLEEEFSVRIPKATFVELNGKIHAKTAEKPVEKQC